MAIEWEEWAKISNVLPWPVNPNVLAKRLEGDHAHIHQHRGPTAGQIADGKGKFLQISFQITNKKYFIYSDEESDNMK